MYAIRSYYVDVEQDQAIGAFANGVQELPLAHAGILIGEVAGDILDQKPATEVILHRLDAVTHMDHGLIRVRQWQKISYNFV